MTRVTLEVLGSGSGSAPEPFVLTLGAEEFTAAAEVPVDWAYRTACFSRDFSSDDQVRRAGALAYMVEAVELCFEQDDWARIVRVLRSDQLVKLANALSNHYAGVDAGESDGSGGSSSSTSTPQQPTSSGSTGSTSPEPSATNTET